MSKISVMIDKKIWNFYDNIAKEYCEQYLDKKHDLIEIMINEDLNRSIRIIKKLDGVKETIDPFLAG